MKRTTILATVVTAALALAAACSGDGKVTGPNNGNQGGGSGGVGGDIGFGNNGSTGGEDACAGCVEEGTGVGTDDPFDVDNNPSDGVGTDDDGALVLDAANSNIPGIIWIANTSEDTVSKVDTTSYQILGRYNIGSNDPSRTSVNSLGDVFVGNRAGNTLTKVSAGGQDCPDTNGDGMVTTSTGLTDVLAWGEDDCVLWNVAVPDTPHVRGVAAQDVTVPDPLPDWPDHTKVEHYVWVGGTGQQKVYKFSGDDGSLLINTTSPTAVYGLALSGTGQLWISSYFENGMVGRIDTTQCADQASCDAAEICQSDCTSGTCICTSCNNSTCDDAIKERIQLPNQTYGVTVDFKQRVWFGGGAFPSGVVQRYDPSQPAGSRLVAVNTYTAGGGLPFIHGIAADANGFVWGADTNAGIVRFEGDNPANNVLVPIGGTKGMAVDKDGKIWGINYYATARVITPGPTIDDNVQTPAAVTTADTQWYTYSDMTGLQLALAANDPGYYRETFDGCEEGTTGWKDLTFDVETPPGTRVRFNVRTADAVADLGAAQWVPVVSIPPGTSPASIQAALDGAGVAPGRFLEVEVVLEGTIDPGSGVISPRVLSFGVIRLPCGGVAN